MPIRPLHFFLPLLGLFFSSACSEEKKPARAPATTLQQSDIEKIVAAYIAEHPEEILTSIQTYMQEKENEKALDYARAHFSELTDPATAGRFSPHTGQFPVTAFVVEFADYNCGFCRKAHGVVKEILQQKKGAVLVVRDLPVITESSRDAALLALAALASDNFAALHDTLMQHDRQWQREDIVALAKQQLNLSQAAIDKLLQDKERIAVLEANISMARAMGIQGTPAFILFDAQGEQPKMVRGFNPDMLRVALDEVAANQN